VTPSAHETASAHASVLLARMTMPPRVEWAPPGTQSALVAVENLDERIGRLEREAEKLSVQAFRSPRKVVDYLMDALKVARAKDETFVIGILDTLVGALMVGRPTTLRMMALAAARGDRIHDGLQGTSLPPDFKAEVSEMISRDGGVDAGELAAQLDNWLSEYNPLEQSSASYDEDWSGATDRRLILAAFPKRLVNPKGRVHVDGIGKHRDGASPRKKVSLCWCRACSAERLLRAAERAMGNPKMTFPTPRKKRAAKK
jgi:hypothetical protein